MRDEAFLATQRDESLFAPDWAGQREALRALFEGASVLVIGGAGSIGAATVRRLLGLGPKRIHVIDIDENGLARLTRSIMAEGRPTAEIFYLAADFGGYPTRAHLETAGPFDVVLDFAAVKHVRSEKTLPALLHMLDVNVVRQDSFFRMLSDTAPPRRLFAVSTDKAADPANFMGATKRLLEEVLYRAGTRGAATSTSSARFANVAFSAGSLLESFGLRMAAGRPLSAPENTRRFFISADEAAQICLLGAACCPPGMAVIPRPTPDLPPTELADVAARFVESTGKRAVFLHDFAEAEAHLREGRDGYPIVLTLLDTVGEKDEEIFVGHGEQEVEIGMRHLLGVRAEAADAATLDAVLAELRSRTTGTVATTSFSEIETLIRRVVTNFRRTGGMLNLDDRV
jgi:FlaA1/EpsC-like NDP-sugar epimerase